MEPHPPITKKRTELKRRSGKGEKGRKSLPLRGFKNEEFGRVWEGEVVEEV